MRNFQKILGTLEKERESAQAEVERIDRAIAAISKLTKAGRGRRRLRRRVSAATRRKMAAAQRRRWAKLKKARPE